MGIMDLSINQEAMGVQSRFGNSVFKLNNFDETDVKGNNNLYNTRKTDTENDSKSLFRDGYSSGNLQVDPSLFSYSSFKKAMDLRTHNRRDDESRRTIFDDADYFAKNFFYKLLPITFEQVDETIIHTEHNYSLFSLNSESETEEDCSRTMDYSQIKEKNYKRRRTKFREGSDEEEWDGTEEVVDSNQNIPNEKEPLTPETEQENAVQPLDLSTAPSVQEHKTDHPHHCQLKDHSDMKEENLPSKLNCIQVTITRPDEKENYQPCDMFLNDIARLVPRLINNDCFEIEILDKTGDRHDDFRKHRLYYIIAESTWRLFQTTRERVILTNDYSLGPLVRKIEKDERPTFLVFDQFSLAKCLAEYCEEIGGFFQYTRVEEGKEIEKQEDVKNTGMIEVVSKAVDMGVNDDRILEMSGEEAKKIETSIEITQTNEAEAKSKLNEKETTLQTENHRVDEESTNSHNGNSEEGKTKSEETENNSIKIKTTECEGKINGVDVKTNEVKMSVTARPKIQTEAEGLFGSSHSKISKPNERRRTRRKKAAANKKKRRTSENFKKENEAQNGDIKPNEVTDVHKNEDKIIAANVEPPEPGNVDTKETSTLETSVKISEREKTETSKVSLEKKREKREVGITKSGEQNARKVRRVQSKKRSADMRETETDSKRKKRKIIEKAVEAKENETQADVINVEETKMDKAVTETCSKIKSHRETRSMAKRSVRNENSKKEPEVPEKKIKMPNKGGAKMSKVLEIKRKEKEPEVEEAKGSSSTSTRQKVKVKNSPPVPMSQIKTRSKSTSESETSQKPNKETQKPKSTLKKSSMKGGRSLDATEKRVPAARVVKENGKEMRGMKRKSEEGGGVGRCLRSNAEKEKSRKVITSKRS